MLLLNASIAAGIAVALICAVTGFVDGVDAFLVGSVVAGLSYAAASLIKPGTNGSIMDTPGNPPNADE